MSCIRYLSTIAPLSFSSYFSILPTFLEPCLRIFFAFLYFDAVFLTVMRLAPRNLAFLRFVWLWDFCEAIVSRFCLRRCWREGAWVSSWCRWCHSRVILRVHILVTYSEYSEYTPLGHTLSTREYTLVSFPGHTQFSRHTRVSGDQRAADE